MAFYLRKKLLPAEVNMLDLAPGALAMTVSYAGRNKVNSENTGAEAAGNPAMQFNIFGTSGA